MAKVELPKVEIRISIPNFEQDNTSIIREAYCSQLVYDTDSKIVRVLFAVQHFSELEDGTKGKYLGSILPDYIRAITASNETMCDVTNGYPIEKIEVGQDEEGNPIFDYDPAINYTGQYDFFVYMGETQPIIIHDLIKSFGLLTNWNVR
jgi:hypothetical protein